MRIDEIAFGVVTVTGSIVYTVACTVTFCTVFSNIADVNMTVECYNRNAVVAYCQ